MTAVRRPGFEQFQEDLLVLIKEMVKKEDILPSTPWLEVGEAGTREAILQAFKKRMESIYGVELVIEPHLVNLDRPVESIAIQLHHVFNTIFLMEQINARIRARLGKNRQG